MATKLDLRQSVLRSALPMVGSAINDTADTLFPKIDAELAKLFEDRNVMLQNGGIITFTGTQIQFTENLELVVNQKISGAAPQVISLGMANVNLANNEMWYAVVDRGAGTATMFIASTLPAVVAANQEVFLIVKRVDAGDGTQRVYWRTGMAQNAGQSNRLGASGSGGSGSGVGDDLNALLYRASFHDPFDEGPTDSKSAVNVTAGFTDAATYNAAKAMYVLNYDASKTIAVATTTTNIELSAVADFTVKIGDVVIANNQARRITAVASQSSFTVDAFDVAPTLASQVTVSQAVHSKDVYNLPVDGNAISAAFSGETFQDVLIDYEDTTTAGDNIFDVNVAPVVAFDASDDGIAFTDVHARPTLEMTEIQSLMLPAAGTGLYVRLYAYKTSGSGTVNVLRYKAFMQKSTIAIAGGIVNTAYGFTDGVGTPINCTIGVSGGKTTVTFDWQYAVDVLENTTASSIEVWLNGQKLPRFVDAVNTPDASFIETSSSIITLDKDYSFQNLAIEVFQRTAVIDNTSQNSTNIAYLQEIQQNGFQSFVAQNQLMNATTTIGTPVAGTFYSTISNRASIVDLTQNLRASMGLDRIVVQSIYQLPNEFGSNGELVFGAVNDFFGTIRFVGAWSTLNDSVGPRVSVAGTDSYVEIVFYGTGLNMLRDFDATAADYRASVDGGTETANLSINASAVLRSRNYSTLQPTSIVKDLALGIHTVKIRSNSATAWNMYGFEVINQSSSLSINPGVSYVNGNKLVTIPLTTSPYNSSFDSGSLGTRGGRVIVYQKADGTIGKSVQSAGSQLNLSSADHSNEEVARVYYPREFGANRADDFSSLTTSTSDRSFTLDDGSTSMVGDDVQMSVRETVFPAGAVAGRKISILFTGTGLDFTEFETATGTLDTVTVRVNGVSIGTLTDGLNAYRIRKIVSGLPYGSHHVTLEETGAAGVTTLELKNFIVYQPKKPSIPSGSIELSDYNVLANYDSSNVTGTTAADWPQLPSGIIYKSPIREFVYVGANWSTTVSAPVLLSGFSNANTNNTQPVSYTFFGTGFMALLRASTLGTYDFSVSIDGVLNASGVTKSNATNLGSGSYRSTSSTADAPCRVEFTGLSLDIHTVTIQRTSSPGTLNFDGLHIITPIHSAKSNVEYDQQNTLLVGSQSLSDIRKLTAIKDVNLQKKNISQAFGVTSAPTTTSASFIPVPELSVVHSNISGRIEISYSISTSNGTGGAGTEVQAYVDGSPIGTPKAYALAGAGNYVVLADTIVLNVSPGVHKVDLYWRTNGGGTSTAVNIYRDLLVEEKD